MGRSGPHQDQSQDESMSLPEKAGKGEIDKTSPHATKTRTPDALEAKDTIDSAHCGTLRPTQTRVPTKHPNQHPSPSQLRDYPSVSPQPASLREFSDKPDARNASAGNTNTQHTATPPSQPPKDVALGRKAPVASRQASPEAPPEPDAHPAGLQSDHVYNIRKEPVQTRLRYPQKAFAPSFSKPKWDLGHTPSGDYAYQVRDTPQRRHSPPREVHHGEEPPRPRTHRLPMSNCPHTKGLQRPVPPTTMPLSNERGFQMEPVAPTPRAKSPLRLPMVGSTLPTRDQGQLPTKQDSKGCHICWEPS